MLSGHSQHPNAELAPRWSCDCTLDAATFWLDALAEAALLGELDNRLVAEGVEHFLASVRREEVAA